MNKYVNTRTHVYMTQCLMVHHVCMTLVSDVRVRYSMWRGLVWRIKQTPVHGRGPIQGHARQSLLFICPSVPLWGSSKQNSALAIFIKESKLTRHSVAFRWCQVVPSKAICHHLDGLSLGPTVHHVTPPKSQSQSRTFASLSDPIEFGAAPVSNCFSSEDCFMRFWQTTFSACCKPR